jgi:putative ABC transport system substrate-binding protein
MQEMRSLGYVEGKNLTMEKRAAGFAKEIVASKPDVIVAVGTPAVAAGWRNTVIVPRHCPASKSY